MKVTFRKFDEGDIIALFPEEKTGVKNYIQSYQHIGQHGDASPELINDLTSVCAGEYEPLLDELKSIGYDNLIINE